MGRKDRRSIKGLVVGDAEKEASTTPQSGGTSGGGGSSMREALGSSALLQYPKPTIVSSPFGQSYLTRKSRPIAADEIQVRTSRWAFNLIGFVDHGAASTVFPLDHNAGETLLKDWYLYARQMGKASLKYKHTPVSLIDTNNVKKYWNAYFFCLANLVMLLNLDQLYQYNQALSTIYTYLPDKMGRVRRLYRRLAAVFAPAGLREHALRSGMIAMDPSVGIPHIRVWDTCEIGTYGGASDYTSQATETLNGVLLDNTKLTVFIDNIEKALWLLETNVTVTTAIQTDMIAIKDMVDMLNDVKPGAFVQGLPKESSFPGILTDASLLNPWYSRGFMVIDTKGVGADQVCCFPTHKLDAFNNLIPLIGKGSLLPEDFALLGAPKFYLLGDSTTGLESVNLGGKCLILGTDIPIAGTTVKGVLRETFYTREDGWIAAVWSSIDYGDAGAILGAEFSGEAIYRHRYSEMRYVSQATTEKEYRFLAKGDFDHIVWLDPDDLGGNHAMLLAQWMGVPYLK